MSDQVSRQEQAGKGALALSDALSLMRQLIAASFCKSVPELVSATVNALMSHQDINGCEVFVGRDARLGYVSTAGTRGSSNLPPALQAWLLAEIPPGVFENDGVHREPSLQRHSDDLSGSVMAVPIGKGAGTIGSLAIWNNDSNHFLPWHETLLEMVADVLLLALTPRPPMAYGKAAGTGVPKDKALQTAAHRHPPFPSEQEMVQTMDSLTGLSDRLTFETRLHELSAAPMPAFRPCFVLFLDIDRFRLIREYGGHMTAERVIRTLAEVLQHQTGAELALGRLGTDEFGVIIERRSLAQAVAVAEALVDQVDAFRMTFAGQRYDVSISVGVAELDTRGRSGPATLRRAMHACRSAQSLGGGGVQVYHERLNGLRGTNKDGWMLNQLTHALKNDCLELYAQLISPLSTEKWDQTGSPHMHELLLRLRDQNGELRNAGTFLPIAERYGLSVKLDRWVIQSAFGQIAKSPLATDARHRFTLNLSGHSIDNHQLLDFIMQEFTTSGLSPERICFEITETAAISDITAAKEFVDALRRVGCQFALDDFGSGHSSFLYLRDLPVDYLKIDGELVREIVTDPVSLAFVRTIQSVGRLMGRQTIAEYVQSQEIQEAIESIGCDYAQGYWVGCPVPLVDVLSKPAT